MIFCIRSYFKATNEMRTSNIVVKLWARQEMIEATSLMINCVFYLTAKAFANQMIGANYPSNQWALLWWNISSEKISYFWSLTYELNKQFHFEIRIGILNCCCKAELTNFCDLCKYTRLGALCLLGYLRHAQVEQLYYFTSGWYDTTYTVLYFSLLCIYMEHCYCCNRKSATVPQ